MLGPPGEAPTPTVTADLDDRQVWIEVDNSELGKQGIGLDLVVLDKLSPEFLAAGYTPVSTPLQGPHVRIRFEVLQLDRYHYGIHFEIVDGDHVEAARKWVACMTCVDAKLIPEIEDNAGILIKALGERRNPQVEGPSEVPAAPVEPPVKSIGPVGFAGIAVATLGAGALVAGAVEYSRGTIQSSRNYGPLTTTEHRPVGGGLLGGAVAGLAGGLSLILADVIPRAMARRRQASLGTPSLSPVLTSSFVGGTYTQRF